MEKHKLNKEELANVIVRVCQSIDKVTVSASGNVDVFFTDSEEPFTSTEFLRGSFTRELIELIEEHMALEHNETQQNR